MSQTERVQKETTGKCHIQATLPVGWPWKSAFGAETMIELLFKTNKDAVSCPLISHRKAEIRQSKDEF